MISIFFWLDKWTPCLLPVAIFVSQVKMQLRQVKENQNGFEINLRCDVMLIGHDEYAWDQKPIPGHVWPSIAFWPLTSYHNPWPHAYSSWPLKVIHASELTLNLIHQTWFHIAMHAGFWQPTFFLGLMDFAWNNTLRAIRSRVISCLVFKAETLAPVNSVYQ